MPRQARQNSQTGIYHIILRGINKQVIFHDNEDRKKFLDCLRVYGTGCQCLIYGYCLMDNHIHLLLQEGPSPIAAFIKKIGVSYVAWYNRKYQRCGHLFQDRFKSEVIEDESYLLTVLRYIHQNPVQAGLAARCEDYVWSSYAEYTGGSAITATAFILGIFAPEAEQAVPRLQAFMAEQAAAACIEMNDTARPTDAQARILIQECIGSDSWAALPGMDKHKRNKILHKIKQLPGVSTWQIARLTGISQSIVARA